MKEKLSMGGARILLAAVVMAGSIVTFNFGLIEGRDTADFLWRRDYCDFGCGPSAGEAVQITTTIEVGQWLAVLLVVIGAFLLWRDLMVGDSAGRRKKNMDADLLYPWAMPNPKWIDRVSARQLDLSRAKIRPYKKIRL